MDIYPDDLGSRCCQQVLEDRMWCIGTDGISQTSGLGLSGVEKTHGEPERKPNFIGEFFIGSLCVAWTISQAVHTSFWISFLVCCFLAILWWQMRNRQSRPKLSTRRDFAEQQKRPYSPLTETEINLLQNKLLPKGCDDSVMDAYLDLIWSAMNLPPFETNGSETKQNVREAIQSLGTAIAIEALPPRMLDGVPDSLAKLQSLSVKLTADAPLETDPVIAASLNRRAEALQGQIETIMRVKVIMRRNTALRDELTDQIGALQTSLAAASLDQDTSGPELALLASSIRRVASEANAVTAARVEVDALLSQPKATARSREAGKPDTPIFIGNQETRPLL